MKMIEGQDTQDIADDEPVFILRASDPMAAKALKHYGRLIQDHLPLDQAIAAAGAVNVHADEMDAYARARGEVR